MPSAPHLPVRVKGLRSHNVSMKLEALEFANHYDNADAAFAFNTTRKSIMDRRKKESELKKLVCDGLIKRKRLHGGGHPIKHPELELLLPSWVKEKRKNNGARVTIRQVKKGECNSKRS